MSQFHYGSIQIARFFIGNDFEILVSIPLWFDSDVLKRAELNPPTSGLNSTMVRFRCDPHLLVVFVGR